MGCMSQCARNVRWTQVLAAIIDHDDPGRVAGDRLAPDTRLDGQHKGSSVGLNTSVRSGNPRLASRIERRGARIIANASPPENAAMNGSAPRPVKSLQDGPVTRVESAVSGLRYRDQAEAADKHEAPKCGNK
jgi:hypothetical protein